MIKHRQSGIVVRLNDDKALAKGVIEIIEHPAWAQLSPCKRAAQQNSFRGKKFCRNCWHVMAIPWRRWKHVDRRRKPWFSEAEIVMMALYEKAYVSLVRRAVFPLHERLKGHSTSRMLREMEKDQWSAYRSCGNFRLKGFADSEPCFYDSQLLSRTPARVRLAA